MVTWHDLVSRQRRACRLTGLLGCRVVAQFPSRVTALAMSLDGLHVAVARAGACLADVHLAPEVSLWHLRAGVCRHTLLHAAGQQEVSALLLRKQTHAWQRRHLASQTSRA